ncbi:fumarylacetoacetate hydrolase [Bosea sp. OK403]|uniref:fumarylacetoacetase n=1 Tax=Bosea sp. OK403 TaxID=1855286 RepID=UPI0008E4DA7A|nr:fumarylacetoacetase [Bosea sp. OK403]SFJ92597.1 fumarylacetoacetate hydrolase [Bosea sp. OK403]
MPSSIVPEKRTAAASDARAAGLDDTHAVELQSWVASARDHAEFPIQNLPFGVFSPADGSPRGGVAIGDEILDLSALAQSALAGPEFAEVLDAASKSSLNHLLALGAVPRRRLRARLSALLRDGSPHRDALASMLHRASDCRMSLPAQIGGYTDFYAGIQHAINIGSLLRPDNPLLPNYKYVPIGYHGRASSVLPSGAPVTRPNGQRKRPEEEAPSFGPCRNLDYELEIGAWIGPGNALGTPIAIDNAEDHVAGLCLLNDWSARDIQAWEYQPLGPFLSKDFATTISPWIVTAEALAPFRRTQMARPEGDPAPLSYLQPRTTGRQDAFDITIEVSLQSEAMRRQGIAPHRVSSGSTRDLYWTVAQLVTHHSSNGCNLQPGDLLGSGTISGRDPGSFGSLMEISRGGRQPFDLPGGETRTYLVDGDDIVMRARASREGYATIGFGECRGRVLPARA